MSADGIERRVVVEITPVIDTGGTRQVFYFGERGFASAAGDTPAHTVVRELLVSAGQWEQDLFGGTRMGGRVVPGGGRIVLNNEAGVLDAWADYGIAGAPVTVRWGRPGSTYPDDYGTIYIAQALTVTVGLSQVELVLRDRLYLLDKPIVTATFSGAGGLEGSTAAGKLKQWVGGDPGFVPPILIDAERRIYFVQDGATGGIQDLRFTAPTDETIVQPFDTYVGAVRLARGANYSSEAEILATAPAAGEVRLWFGPASPTFAANKLGPVYLRLGSEPLYPVRVFPSGYAPSGNLWRFHELVARAGLDVAVNYSGVGAVSARLVDDGATYLEVMDDAGQVDVVGYGFTRLDEFFSVALEEPEDADTVVWRQTPIGGAEVTRARFTFTRDNARAFTRLPVAGMAAPMHTVTMAAGDVWPCEIDPLALPYLRDYMTREGSWVSFSGTNPAILAAHPGASTVNMRSRQREFQNRLGQSRWVQRMLTLFGGLRWIMQLEADMTDETLAIELMDNAIVDIPRMGCSGGRAFRVVSRSIDVDARIITFGLWGGTAGPGGYIGTEPGGAPPVVNPALSRGLIPAYALEAYGRVKVGGAAALQLDNLAALLVARAYGGGVKLLLNFNNADGSTAIDDESDYALSATGTADLRCGTSQAKFGTASLKITKRDDGPVSFTGAEFGKGASQPVAVDGWIYHVTTYNSTTSPMIFRWAFSSGFHFDLVNYGNTAKLQLGTSGFGDETTPTAYTSGGWRHIRCQLKADGTIWLRVDGVSMFTGVAGDGNAAATGTFYVGSFAGTGSETTEFYIDNLRAIRGYEFTDADFTPPAAATTTALP